MTDACDIAGVELAEFLRRRAAELVDRWRVAVERRARPRSIDRADLVDHVPAILAGIADAVDPLRPERAPPEPALAAHALARVAEGLDLPETLRELGVLRATLLHGWEEEGAAGALPAARLLDRALDHVIEATARIHVEQRSRSLVALDRISACALANESLPALLDALLEAVAAGCPSVDAAAFLLLEGDRLRLASTRGIEPAPPFSLAVGEGFAGEVAATRRPIATSGGDPRVRHTQLRAHRAVYGLPLLSAGELVGVALAATSRADGFGATDRQLLSAMAERAAAGIRMHALRDATVASEAAARRGEERLGFLAEASRLLSGSLDVRRTAQQLAALAVPRLADWCILDLVEPGGAIAAAAVVTSEPDPLRLERIHAYRARRPPTVERPYGTSCVVATGEPLHLREVTPEALRPVAPDEEYVRWVCEAGIRSVLSVPLRGRSGVLGAFALGTAASGRVLGDAERTLAQELAALAALALDNARLYEEAQRAVLAREQVLAVVSHDLRTPLHAIALTAQILARKPLDESAQRNVASIRRATERGTSLLRDLLDMASIQAGRLAVTPVPADADRLAAEAIELQLPAAQARAVELAREGQGGAVRADPDRIVQVLANLLGNAVNVAPAGSRVVLRLRAAPDGVRLEVEDAGPGIPPEELPRLFEAYWTRQRGRGAGHGTGLGLFISNGIVEAHGARFEVRSALGRGSTFGFTLRRA